MKKIIVYAVSMLFLILACPLNVFAQGSGDASAVLTEEEKKAAEAAAVEREIKMREYSERKADLELQLSKLSRDKRVAAQDKNKALEDKRTGEIRQTRNQLKALDKEYGIESDGKEESPKAPAAQKKSEPNVDMNALNRELAREIAKMEGRDSEDEKSAPAKKPAPAKKK